MSDIYDEYFLPITSKYDSMRTSVETHPTLIAVIDDVEYQIHIDTDEKIFIIYEDKIMRRTAPLTENILDIINSLKEES